MIELASFHLSQHERQTAMVVEKDFMQEPTGPGDIKMEEAPSDAFPTQFLPLVAKLIQERLAHAAI